jgi:isoleucyl-tRNA synthetase
MFRATDQWFCDLQKNDLVKKALQELKNIHFIPKWGENRLAAFLENRTEWCISRQKQWGVPIPAVICKKCDHAHLNAEFVRVIAKGVAQHGIEFWDTYEIKHGFTCENCNNNDATLFAKETDILDVWFDSGISHYAVIQKQDAFPLPVDLYLEGSDQHRGWFQSSLLCSMVLNNKPCTKAILTHGFVVDEKGRKMSKSFGNVIAPDDVIQKYSRDIVRSWVASADYKNDVAVSFDILKQVSEMYRKIRNTCRFMISSLYDFDITKDAVSCDALLQVDQYALARLYNVNHNIVEHYNNYDFSAMFHALNHYCANDLSSVYLDICKDRLYIERAESLLRRSAQTAIYHILDTITHLMAPILSFLAEEVSDFYQKDKRGSIHLQEFINVMNVWELVGKTQRSVIDKALAARLVKSSYEVTYPLFMQGVWNVLEELRAVVLKAIENKRAVGIVKHSLESKVSVFLNPESDQKKLIDQFIMVLTNNNEDINRFFKDWCIVSQFEFVDVVDACEKSDVEWVYVHVDHAQGEKCPRCWQWEATQHPEALCKRCVSVLKK